MRVCILGDGLSSLALAKVLTNQNIFVDVISFQKKIIPLNKSRTLGISKSNIPAADIIIPKISVSLLIVKLINKLAVFFKSIYESIK